MLLVFGFDVFVFGFIFEEVDLVVVVVVLDDLYGLVNLVLEFFVDEEEEVCG